MKKGDTVKFKTSSGIIKTGNIVGMVKAGDVPKFSKFSDLHKRGLSNMNARTERSFLISDGTQLYWPKNKNIM